MLKKQKASFYVFAATVVSALISLILFLVSNKTMGYPITGSTTAIICTAAAMVIGVGALFAQMKNMNELLVSALRIATLALMAVALTVTLADRAVVAGGLFTWNSLDTFAWSAFYTGVACMVFQVLTVLLTVVSGCMKQNSSK